jgi:hypothetical protein
LISFDIKSQKSQSNVNSITKGTKPRLSYPTAPFKEQQMTIKIVDLTHKNILIALFFGSGCCFVEDPQVVVVVVVFVQPSCCCC